jgi:chorismate mutase-like protein
MEKLQEFRNELNELDQKIIELLGKRFEVIRNVGHYKKETGIAMMQPKRVDEVKDRCALIGEKYSLDGDFVRTLYSMIIDEACRIEDLIIDEQ